MKKLIAAAGAALFIFGAGTAVQAIHEEIPSETQIPEPGPDAEGLYKYITANKYGSWAMWPGKERFYPGREPHGSLLTTYINSKASFSIKDKKGLSEGSIIIKENYKPDKTLAALTVMYKLRGFNPKGGDWFWAKYSPDGTVLASGKVQGCIDCHSRNKSNDFIMTGPVK